MKNSGNGKKRAEKKDEVVKPEGSADRNFIQAVWSKMTWRSMLPWICLAAWCLLCGLMRAWPKSTVLNNPSSGTDYFAPLIGAWGLKGGLKLHADLSSPLGVLFYAPYYWCTVLFGMTDAVVRYTQAGLLVAISIISFVAFRPPRFNWVITACATAYFSLFATSPSMTGDSFFNTYEGLAYNRLAVVLGQIAILIALFPRIQNGLRGRATEMKDAVLMAFLLTWVFFIKPNLIVSDTFLILAGLILFFKSGVRRSWSFYATCLVSLSVFVFLVLLYFNLSLGDMFKDLKMATHARGNTVMKLTAAQYAHESGMLTWGVAGIYTNMINRLYNTFLDFVPVLPLVVGGLAWAAACTPVKLSRLFALYAFLGILFLTDSLLPTFNSCSMTLGFTWIIALCFYSQFRPLIPDEQGRRFYSIIYALFVGVIILSTGRIFAEHVVACAYNVAAPKWFPPQNPNSAFKADDHIGGGHFGRLYILCGDADNSGYPFAKRINLGLDLIQKHGFGKKTIFDLDFVNPFPVVLNSPYPSGQPVWLDGGGTFDNQNHLAPEVMFKGTDVILTPKQTSAPQTESMLVGIYGKYLQDNFVYVDQNECWQLSRRKNFTDSPDYQVHVVDGLQIKAQNGDAQAQLQLAKDYLSGEGVPASTTNAFQWLGMAAKQGLAEAECQLGVCYAVGQGTTNDYAAALLWFRKAADQGSADAQYNLGSLYQNGLGVTTDITNAATWYQLAGEKGHILAQNSLALILFNSNKDYPGAAKWFLKAAEQGNSAAQNSMGCLYLQGMGVKQDANEALKWFQKSAAQGFAEAQNNCAMVLFNSQRFAESAQWFRKAADQGFAESQFSLAQFYQRGLVYPQDLGESLVWYTKAANQGHGQAQLALGTIYHDGQGVKADLVEAYKWFKLAQLQGVADAGKALADCRATMSIEQIKTAENEITELQKPK